MPREELRERLSVLPLRAVVAFAARCAQRVEPYRQLRFHLPNAYSSGLGPLGIHALGPAHAAEATRSAARAAFAAVYHAEDRESVLAHAVDAAMKAATADESLHTVHLGDLAALRALPLGTAGEPGEPIAWNDKRLGVLWPNGEPEWYAEAKKAVRELEYALANLPDPNNPPLSPGELLQIDAMALLDGKFNRGELEKYAGKYVISDGETIFAHGRDLVKIRPKAEEKARAKSVTPNQLVNYFVPGI